MWLVLTLWNANKNKEPAQSHVRVVRDLDETNGTSVQSVLIKWASKVSEKAKDSSGARQFMLTNLMNELFGYSVRVCEALARSKQRSLVVWAQSLFAIAYLQVGDLRRQTLQQAKDKFEAIDLATLDLETQLKILMMYGSVTMELDLLQVPVRDTQNKGTTQVLSPSNTTWARALEIAEQLSAGIPTVVRQAKSMRPEMRMDRGLVLHTWASRLMELAQANPTTPHANRMLADAVSKYRQSLAGDVTVTIAAERLAKALQVYGAFLMGLIDNSKDARDGLSIAEAAEAQFKEQYAISRAPAALYSVAYATFKAAKLEEVLHRKLERADEACCLLDMITSSQRNSDVSLMCGSFCLWGDVLYESAGWLENTDMLAADKRYVMAYGKYYVAHLQEWRRGCKDTQAYKGISKCQEAFLDLNSKQFLVQRGVLVKQGEIVTSWKTRFFTLSGSKLSYWRMKDWERKQAGDIASPLGEIPLRSITGMVSHDRWPWPMKLPYQQGFHLLTQHRAYHFAIPNGEFTPRSWITSIQHMLAIQQVVESE
jgi:hypothetical protein